MLALLAFGGGLLLPEQEVRWQARLADGSVQAVVDEPPRDWFVLEKASGERPEYPQGPQLILHYGQPIPAVVRGSERDRLIVELRPAGTRTTCRLPLTAIDMIWLNPPFEDSQRSPEALEWLAERGKADVVRLANGEVLRGLFEGLSERNELQLRQNNSIRSIPLANVHGIALNPALAVARPFSGSYYRVVAADGSRLLAKTVTFHPHELELTLLAGVELSLPRTAVAAITHWSDAVVPLNALRPSRAVVEPLGRLAWEWQVNQTVKKRPLTLSQHGRAMIYDDGLGTHPRTTLSYQLDRQFRAFAATVGLDAETGQRGKAIIQVQADDKPLLQPSQQLLRAVDGPRVLHLDITGCQRLTLTVDFGPGFGVQADVNWIEARLIR